METWAQMKFCRRQVPACLARANNRGILSIMILYTRNDLTLQTHTHMYTYEHIYDIIS